MLTLIFISCVLFFSRVLCYFIFSLISYCFFFLTFLSPIIVHLSMYLSVYFSCLFFCCRHRVCLILLLRSALFSLFFLTFPLFFLLYSLKPESNILFAYTNTYLYYVIFGFSHDAVVHNTNTLNY